MIFHVEQFVNEFDLREYMRLRLEENYPRIDFPDQTTEDVFWIDESEFKTKPKGKCENETLLEWKNKLLK